MNEVAEDRVKDLMRLARLALPPEEALRLTKDLGRLLEYVGQLTSVELNPGDAELTDGRGRADSGPPPPLRDDVPRPGLPRSVATSGVDHAPAGLFSVPKVIAQAGPGEGPAPPGDLGS